MLPYREAGPSANTKRDRENQQKIRRHNVYMAPSQLPMPAIPSVQELYPCRATTSWRARGESEPWAWHIYSRRIDKRPKSSEMQQRSKRNLATRFPLGFGFDYATRLGISRRDSIVISCGVDAQIGCTTIASTDLSKKLIPPTASLV